METVLDISGYNVASQVQLLWRKRENLTGKNAGNISISIFLASEPVKLN